MTREIELKLVVAPEAADALAASQLLGRCTADVVLSAVYFDTPDHKLRRNGLSLRIRGENGRQIQAVKATDTAAAGLFSRAEWEREVESNRPEPDPRAPLADLLGGDASELAEQFRVIVNRRNFAATDGNAWFDAAIDFGEITVDGRFGAFCEVELELKSGEPAALFRLARRIGAQAPARIGVLSKAERGYRLLGPILAAEKAEKLRLDPCMSVVDGFAAVVHACLKQYRLNETIALERRCPAAVHQARVAVRRLRTALSIFRPLLRCDGMSRELNTRLRDLAREFGKVRDLDILIAHPTSAP
ncbi:MAG: CYTH domain-containing protein, partial [Novosphingobium sp.]|nr:CYTH domain-containing protein [Novosphingobium sp.]